MIGRTSGELCVTDDFTEARLALVGNGALLVQRRVETAGAAAHRDWDLPGGARESAESAEDCVIRHIWEDLGLFLGAGDLIWRGRYGADPPASGEDWLFTAALTAERLATLGDGGGRADWQLWGVAQFLRDPQMPDPLLSRLGNFLFSEGVIR